MFPGREKTQIDRIHQEAGVGQNSQKPLRPELGPWIGLIPTQ
jgi:hypothetical protein